MSKEYSLGKMRNICKDQEWCKDCKFDARVCYLQSLALYRGLNVKNPRDITDKMINNSDFKYVFD